MTVWRRRGRLSERSVLYCVQQLYTVIRAHTHEQFLQVSVGLGLGLVLYEFVWI